LDELCSQTDFAANWLILDCLPALPLLQGAEAVLSGVDVGIVRLIADNGLCPGTQAIHQDIESFMQAQGFCCFGLEPERHPALAHAVYLRDYAGLVRQQQINAENERNKFNRELKSERQNGQAVKQQLDETEKQLKLARQEVQELDAVKKELTVARDGLVTQLKEQVHELKITLAEKEQQAAQLNQSENEIADLQQKLNEQVELSKQFKGEKQKLQSQLDRLEKEKTAVEKKNAEALERHQQKAAREQQEQQKQIDALNQKYRQSEQKVQELTEKERDLQKQFSSLHQEKATAVQEVTDRIINNRLPQNSRNNRKVLKR